MRRLSLGLVATALSLLAVEGAARILFPGFGDGELYVDRAFRRVLNSEIRWNPESPAFSERFGFRNAPLSEHRFTTPEYDCVVKTNSLGFRSREITVKRENEYRVLLLGDSFFAGYGVSNDELLSAEIERIASRRLGPGKPVTVYDYAVGGYNTVQQLLVARTYVPQVNPDHIILGLFVGNDVIPNAIAFVDDGGNYATDADKEREVRRMLRQKLGWALGSRAFRVAAQDLYLPRLRYQIGSQPAILARTVKLLQELDADAEARGIRFSVVIIYPRDAVRGGLVASWSGSRRLGRTLAGLGRANQIEIVDLMEHISGYGAWRDFYFREDGHFSPQGHAHVAQVVYRELLQRRVEVSDEALADRSG